MSAGENWSSYLGHPTSSQFSSLDQINKSNVTQLEVAWTYVTGDSAMYQNNNLIIDGILFTATPTRKVMAVNAATGKHIWTFDAEIIHPGKVRTQQRGTMYWEEGENKRLFSPRGSYLYSLDAKTGQLDTAFGEGGFIHLGDGMDVEGRPNVGLNTPGYIYKDKIIIGANVAENVPGAVRAFDVRTGERKWIFHTLPRPGEFGSETWPEGYLEKTGGASDWSGLAIDTERGIVYSSTETAGPDFYGGDRYGENLFANSLIALDANTGERLWHFQLVHHDLWDMDNPAPPNLMTVKHDGKMVDIVVQGTKRGLLYAFNRVTGEPLWPIEERPAPQSEIPGVKSWPTQPFPTKPEPLTRQLYTADDISNISPEAAQLSKDIFEQVGSAGSLPAPSLEPTIIFPGFDGGMEWGGAAADPDGILYVNVSEMPWYYQLVQTKKEGGEDYSAGERVYRVHCASCHGLDRAGSAGGEFPSLIDIGSRKSKGEVMTTLKTGAGRMPAFDQLSDSRLTAIQGFLFGDESDSSLHPSNFAYGNEARETEQPYVFRGFHRVTDQEGYPAIKPPWGSLKAVDMNSGEIKWSVPLGEFPELTARGIAVTGQENYGGPVVTAGGLVFISATKDNKMRAFDKDTGEQLWEADLPFDGNSTPSIYMVDGKQYVVISAGGAKIQRPKGGHIVAFALPE